MLDEYFTLANIIINHKVPVLDVLGPFGDIKPAIPGQQDFRFFYPA